MSAAYDLFPPGEYIRDELGARGWSQEDLASIMGRPSKTVSQIVNGVKSITPQTAKQLAAAFGTSAELWLNLESSYRLAKEESDNSDVARRAKLYDRAPIAEMRRRGWIASCETIDDLAEAILTFEGVRSLEEMPSLAAAARKSTDETTASQIAWLCRVKNLAHCISAEKFTLAKMNKHLGELHALTTSEQEVRKVPVVLAKMGIRFLVVQHLPRTKIDGYTLWLDKASPVIAMSLRHDRIDGFWHTLAHEMSHVRHGDRPLVDYNLIGADQESTEDPIEIRADSEATGWLIDPSLLRSFINRTKPRYSKKRVIQFANLHQIHPGIVVGQLQHLREIDFRHNREMLVGVRDILMETSITDGWGHVPAFED